MPDILDVNQQAFKLDNALKVVQMYAENSLKRGIFLTSEPEITYDWVDLGIFQHSITSANLQDHLIDTIFWVVECCIEGYRINRGDVTIVNMCSKYSGIANELKMFHDLSDSEQEKPHKIPICDVKIGRSINTIDIKIESHEDLSTPLEHREVVLLVPVDSYVTEIAKTLEFLRGHANIVTCVVSLFSVAKTWDYVTATDYFDVIPLFRVRSSPAGQPGTNSIQRLTNLDSFRQRRPWFSV